MIQHAPPKPPWLLSRRPWRRTFVYVAIIVLLAGTAWQTFWWLHLKRFQEVRPGQVYRSAQPSEFGFWYLAQRRGLRTVISLRLEDAPLAQGIVDFNHPDGQRESDYLRQLGVRLVNWPMGHEACWPWLNPWQFEEFYNFFDEPANLPVVLHCVGGRHRTGTMLALYRLEYDRWPADRAIQEMLSFSFGPVVPDHDLHLRTYSPRPRPNAAVFERLREHFSQAADTPADYESLVRSLLHAADRGHVLQLVEAYVRSDGPFALPLVQRLIDAPGEPLATLAAERAAVCLSLGDANPIDWTAAAALVADFGDTEQQLRLLDILSGEDYRAAPSPRYQACVAGVTNRYTPNRIAFLRPLLHDHRHRPEVSASAYRYCDTAVARLTAIIDGKQLRSTWNWDEGVHNSLAWFDSNQERAQLSRLLPPTGRTDVLKMATAADADRVSR